MSDVGNHVTSLVPRVAFLPDSYYEVNGAARTCRELTLFARRRQYPFLLIHCGPDFRFSAEEPAWSLQLKRSRLSIPVDADLRFDPTFYRQRQLVEETVRRFRAGIIHITSPGDVGIIGALTACKLHIPLVAS